MHRGHGTILNECKPTIATSSTDAFRNEWYKRAPKNQDWNTRSSRHKTRNHSTMAQSLPMKRKKRNIITVTVIVIIHILKLSSNIILQQPAHNVFIWERFCSIGLHHKPTVHCGLSYEKHPVKFCATVTQHHKVPAQWSGLFSRENLFKSQLPTVLPWNRHIHT